MPDRIESFEDPDECDRRFAALLADTIEVESVSGLVIPGSLAPCIVARCPGFDLQRLPEGEERMDWKWDMLIDQPPGRQAWAILHLEWPRPRVARRLRVSMNTPAGIFPKMIREWEGKFGITATPRGEMPEQIIFVDLGTEADDVWDQIILTVERRTLMSAIELH